MPYLNSIIFLQDSLTSISDSIETGTLENISNSSNSSTYSVFFSSGVIIVLFIIERIITHLTRKKQYKTEFYLEIIIKPNLDKILLFFENFYTDIIEAVENVKAFDGKTEELTQLKIDHLQNIKNKKVKFDHILISLIRSMDREKSTSLTDLLNELEDLATNCLTQLDIDKVDIVGTEKHVHQLKANFFEILYQKNDT